MVNKLALALALLFTRPILAQHQYNKAPDPKLVRKFDDTLNRVKLSNGDSSDLLVNEFNYVLRFYPKMLLKNILVDIKPAKAIVRTRPKFSSIFKAPADRVYKITLSSYARATLDSVTLHNLSFNSQLGLIATQVSTIEDLSTGGFLDFISWYFRRLRPKGKNKIAAEAELKTLEVGLGYQLLALNKEIEIKLQIDNWQSTRGYDYYARYLRNCMKPTLISDLIRDLPVYVTQPYQ